MYFIQGNNSTRPPIQFYEICYVINNNSACKTTNKSFLIINETTFSGQTFSFTLIANNLYGNTTLYNNSIRRFYIFNRLLLLLLFSLFIAVSDSHTSGIANNFDDTSTIISIIVCLSILVMLTI